MKPDRFGVYVHVPFCRHRCDYCAFATWTDRTALSSRYLDACITHARRELDGAPAPSSVFVGGGTPSLVDPEHLARLIVSLGAGPDAEVTVESNPDDVTPEWLEPLCQAGVNRLSIGVQSMDRDVLAALGRTHDPENVARAAQAAHRFGLTFNVDLIYGAHGETMQSWRDTLLGALALEPTHISAYALTVEPGTPLARYPDRFPDDDDQAAKYLLATEMLGTAGFDWYEISNWSRPGHRCVHNLTYWLGGDYAAVGCAAHGYRAGRRHWNVYTPERYVDAVESSGSVIAGSELLDTDSRRLERLGLLIRTGAGVPLDAFAIEDLRGPLAGLVHRVESVSEEWGVGAGPRLVLTERGRLLGNEVAIRLR